jgi:nicotinamide phosphoribosyltransferase
MCIAIWNHAAVDFPETVFFGLHYYLKKFLTTRVTTEMIDRAENDVSKRISVTVAIFNRKGWEHIVEKHGGYLPLRVNVLQKKDRGNSDS